MCMGEIELAHSPWSSSEVSNLPTTQSSHLLANSNSPSEAYVGSDEMDMSECTDPFYHPAASTTRIATQTTNLFAHHLPQQFDHSMSISPEAASQNYLHHLQGRRPPSPISEGSVSPVKQAFVQEDVMDMDVSSPEKVTPKKGHSRNRHATRNHTGFTPENAGVKRFSMGYRADCEKCRMKVPGHYSHVVFDDYGA